MIYNAVVCTLFLCIYMEIYMEIFVHNFDNYHKTRGIIHGINKSEVIYTFLHARYTLINQFPRRL